ncbi:putative protein kinase [Septoria linicola]|nr:putative protein kinase [Septoria linicola]
MPHRFPFASHTAHDDTAVSASSSQELGAGDVSQKRLRQSSLFRKSLSLWRRHHADTNEQALPQTAPTELAHIPEYFARRSSLPDNVPAGKRAIPSLPRPQTFRRQESEKREKLLEVEPTTKERRALSEDRRRSSAATRTLSPRPFPLPSLSAPDVADSQGEALPGVAVLAAQHVDTTACSLSDLPPLQIPNADEQRPFIDDDRPIEGSDIDRATLLEEYDRRWILNLSMHFRDKSNREKFFVTYAERPTQWRRLTISLDYRDAPEESLEADLSTLHYQRDKSLRIYEAIRDSLPDIQYYDTVTNLKLETTADDGQLHVHVREDANEIVDWPEISLFNHIQCPRFNESSLEFDSHLSGFVYKVRLNGRVVIKKEIPGPDTVDEFIYELNALDSLIDSKHVVHLEGLVTDDRGESVRGLLISYATQGALVDMVYDFRGSSSLSWHRREKWAKQIVSGLADIHEAGFVQGDFTLSNIVIDADDNAQIIDVNRRGCPVGWEPPELNKLIDSGQRISMCIGVKTDLFQLGMVLWALAEEVDEPERVERPLPPVVDGTPGYLRTIVEICLSERPQGRKSAVQLLQYFPRCAGQSPSRRVSAESAYNSPFSNRSSSSTAHRSAKQYIDPDMAITIDDIKRRRMQETTNYSSRLQDAVTYMQPFSNPPSMYAFESEGSYVVGGRRGETRSRGRSPASSRRRRSSPLGRTVSSATSYENSPTRHRYADRRSDCSDSESEVQYRREDSGWQRPISNGNRIDDAGSVSPVSRRIADLQSRDPVHVGELLHTDSVFDEMMDNLDLNATPRRSDFPEPPSTPRPSSVSEPPTPGSFYTPAVTPIESSTKINDSNTSMAVGQERCGADDCQHTTMMNDDSNVARIPVTQNGTLVVRKE